MTGSSVPAVRWGREHLPDLATAVVVASPTARRIAHAAGLSLGNQVIDRCEAGVWAAGAEQVVGVGSGSTIDAAKLLAYRTSLPLTVIPTVLSTDAAFSTVSARHHPEVVDYEETGSPDQVVIDPDVLAQTPWPCHLQGLGDLLAVQASAADWAHHAPDVSAARAAGLALCISAIEAIDTWREPSEQASKFLIDLLRTKVGLGLVAGHARLEEGTEHYLAYRLERHLDRPVWHGELLMACLPVCAALQGWDEPSVGRYRRFHQELGVWRPGGAHLIASTVVRSALLDLHAYCHTHDLTNSIAYSAPPDAAQVEAACRAWDTGW